MTRGQARSRCYSSLTSHELFDINELLFVMNESVRSLSHSSLSHVK
jgi:hypothetical protein